MLVLSYVQARNLLDGRRQGHGMVRTSLDLGLSQEDVLLDVGGVRLAGGARLSWSDVETVWHSEPICFQVLDDTVHRIHRYSTHLRRSYSLMATGGAPTIINSGFTMHRIVGVDPREDTIQKLRALGLPRGRVLDTATGLGYTAIEAARTATQVVTVEIDPLVLDIARLNPWSRSLFEQASIEQLIGASEEVIRTFPDEHFTQIMHDPPTVSLAGELYGSAFYAELFRVLRHGGTVFHYVGNLRSKQGSSVAKGVVRRLFEAGFQRITPRFDAFGIVAIKG